MTVRGQAAIGVAATAGSTAVGFLATSAIAHLAGPDVLGGYLVVAALLNVVLLAGDPGLGASAFQRIAAGDEPDAYFSALVAARIGLLVVLLAAVPFLPGIDPDLRVLLGLAVAVSTGASLAITGVLGVARAGVAATADFAGAVVRSVAQIAATVAGFGVAGLLAGFVAGSAATGLIDRRFLPLRLSRFGRRHLEGFLPFAAWSFLTGIVAVAVANGDTLLVGAMLDQRDVALYRIPLQLAAMAALVGVPIRASIMPHLVRAGHGGSLEDAGALLGRARTAAFLCATPVVAGGCLLADCLLYTLYGPAFAAGAPVLVCGLLAAAVNLLPLLDGAAIAAFGRPKRQFAAAVVGAVALLGLDAALIPAWGIAGAGAVLLAATCATAIVTGWLRSRLVAVPVDLRSVAAVAGATLAMAAAVVALKAALPTGPVALVGIVAGGAAVYGVVLVMLEPSVRADARNLMLSVF